MGAMVLELRKMLPLWYMPISGHLCTLRKLTEKCPAIIFSTVKRAIFWKVHGLRVQESVIDWRGLVVEDLWTTISKDWWPRLLLESFSTRRIVPSLGRPLDYVTKTWCPRHPLENFSTTCLSTLSSVGKSLDYVLKERYPRHLLNSLSTIGNLPSIGWSLDYVPQELCLRHVLERFSTVRSVQSVARCFLFYCEKKYKYKKKGLGNAHPDSVATSFLRPRHSSGG
jgi:hypothetical protein